MKYMTNKSINERMMGSLILQDVIAIIAIGEVCMTTEVVTLSSLPYRLDVHHIPQLKPSLNRQLWRGRAGLVEEKKWAPISGFDFLQTRLSVPLIVAIYYQGWVALGQTDGGRGGGVAMIKRLLSADVNDDEEGMRAKNAVPYFAGHFFDYLGGGGNHFLRWTFCSILFLLSWQNYIFTVMRQDCRLLTSLPRKMYIDTLARNICFPLQYRNTEI